MPDIVVANSSANSLSVLFNMTATNASIPSFAAKIDLPVALKPQSVAIGDLNGDGKPDLVSTNVGSNTISVLLAK